MRTEAAQGRRKTKAGRYPAQEIFADMIRSLTTAGTGMISQQQNLDVIANNLANVNTTSFKSQRAEFQDLMYQTFKASGVSTGNTSVQPLALQIGLGSKFSSNATNFGPGPLQA